MEIKTKKILYGGVSTVPSAYASADGELDACVGAVAEDGGLRIVSEGADIGIDFKGYTPVYVHRNTGFYNFIAIQTGFLAWTDRDGTAFNELFRLERGETFAKAASIGNMLIVTTDKSMHYVLWQDGEYHYKGTGLPEIDIVFSNHGYFGEGGYCVSGKANIKTPQDGGTAADREAELAKCVERPRELAWDSLSYKINDYFTEWPEWDGREVATVKDDNSANDGKNYPQLFTDKCYNALNNIVADAKAQGLFVMPRLVRAAWRLWDGTYAKYTTPVLVFCTGTRHLQALEGMDVPGSDKNICARIYPFTVDYFLRNDIENLKKDWGDLIKGITFFAGSEIYDYDQQGLVKSLRRTYYTEWSYQEQIVLHNTHYYAELPRIDEGDQVARLKDGGPFYKMYDRELEEQSGSYVLLQVRRIIEDDSIVAIKQCEYELTFTYTKKGEEGIENKVVLTAAEGDSLDGIYDKLARAVRAVTGWDVEVHKMYMPKVRVGKKLYDHEVGIAIVPSEDAKLSVEIGPPLTADPSAHPTLDVFGINCYGSPLPSDRLPLKVLETQTHINDDYLQHVGLLPSVMRAYNNRLNMGNLQVKHEDYHLTLNDVGFAPDGMTSGSGYRIEEAWYYIRTQKGETVVSITHSGESTGISTNTLLHYLYYPDTRCYKAVLRVRAMLSTSDKFYLSMPMTPSNTLNGAVFAEKMPYYDTPVNSAADGYAWHRHFFQELENYRISSFTEPTDTGAVEDLPNTILVSNVDNPLNWEASQESSVGNGEIMLLMPNTRALSEGQYGQHPMYAFTTDEGVWAMKINEEGRLIAEQPVTRDTLSDPRSVAQLDTSILFATKRGVMELVGSSSRCITDKIGGKAASLTTLPGWDTLLELAGKRNGNVPADGSDFTDFIVGCRIGYDYIRQRIYVWNPAMGNNARKYGYAHVYSLKSKTWGLVECSLLEPLNTYPESLVTTEWGVTELGLLGDSGSSGASGRAIIVTRPFKIEDLDALKTIYDVVQRGTLRLADSEHWLKQALWGSRDLWTWRLIGSSASAKIANLGGTPWKYFRLAVIWSGSNDESVEAVEVNWRYKYGNKMR